MAGADSFNGLTSIVRWLLNDNPQSHVTVFEMKIHRMSAFSQHMERRLGVISSACGFQLVSKKQLCLQRNR